MVGPTIWPAAKTTVKALMPVAHCAGAVLCRTSAVVDATTDRNTAPTRSPEAMTLGRVAIATGYSGNLNFMTPETSLLVDYDLIPVPADAYLFPEGQVWADAHVDHAVQLMARMLDDPAEARALGRRASRHIRTNFSARAVGLRYTARLDDLAEA